MTDPNRTQALFDGTGAIHDDYIKEAEATSRPFRLPLPRIAVLAAAVALFITISVLWNGNSPVNSGDPVFVITAQASGEFDPYLQEIIDSWLSSTIGPISESEIPYYLKCMPQDLSKTFHIRILAGPETDFDDLDKYYPVVAYNGKRVKLDDSDSNVEIYRSLFDPTQEGDYFFILDGWFTEPTQVDILLYQRGALFTPDKLIQRQSFLISFSDGDYVIEPQNDNLFSNP